MPDDSDIFGPPITSPTPAATPSSMATPTPDTTAALGGVFGPPINLGPKPGDPEAFEAARRREAEEAAAKQGRLAGAVEEGAAPLGSTLGAYAGYSVGMGLGGPPLATAFGIGGSAIGNIAGEEISHETRAAATGQPYQPVNIPKAAAWGTIYDAVPRVLGKFLPPVGRYLQQSAELPPKTAVNAAGEEAATGAMQKSVESGAPEELGRALGSEPAQREAALRAYEDRNNLSGSQNLKDTRVAVQGAPNRAMDRVGENIGKLLEDVRGNQATTKNLDSRVDEINKWLTSNQNQPKIISPAVQKELGTAGSLAAGTDPNTGLGNAKVGDLVERWRAIGENFRSGSLKENDAYVMGQLRDAYMDDLAADTNVPKQRQPALQAQRNEYYQLNRFFDKDYWRGIKGAETGPEVAEAWSKISGPAQNRFLAESTPQEIATLRQNLADHIGGADDPVKAFQALEKKNPRALRKIFGDGPFENAQAWATVKDMDQVRDKFVQRVGRDPIMQELYNEGEKLAQNSPEYAVYQREYAKLANRPDYPLIRARAEAERIQTPYRPAGGEGTLASRMNMRYLGRWGFREWMLGLMGLGIGAKHPVGITAAALALMTPDAVGNWVRRDPERYYSMLKWAERSDSKAARNVGYLSSRLMMSAAAEYLQNLNQELGPPKAPMAAPAPVATPGGM